MRTRTLLLVAVASAAIAVATRATDTAGHDRKPQAPPAAATPPGPRTVTSDDLHRLGGVPRGWKFTLPAGDPARGRQVFADLECFKCHVIKDGNFPSVEADPRNAGPELTGMGNHHPAEYLAESILLPNSVILTGRGHTGPDGLSIMPSFADAISVTQLVDLVAFLKSQTGEDPHAMHGRDAEREAVAGEYRVRLVFASHGAGHAHHGAGHGHHGPHGAGAQGQPMAPGADAASQQGGHAQHGGHGQHGAPAVPDGASATATGHAPAASGRGHLMAFVADREHGDSVPYLRVTATVQATGTPPRTIMLTPMVSDRGFHYGADVVLPARTQKITLSIGPTSMAVMGGMAGRYKSPVSAPFEWQAAAR